ncbi:hypothetical protein ACFQXA_37330 [Nocardiopsis composta]
MSVPAPRTPPPQEAARSRRPVLAAHAVLAGIGLLFFLGSFAYPWTNPEDGTVGPAALPRTAGLLLLLAGLALIRRELRGGTVLEGDGHVEEEAEHTPESAARSAASCSPSRRR